MRDVVAEASAPEGAEVLLASASMRAQEGRESACKPPSEVRGTHGLSVWLQARGGVRQRARAVATRADETTMHAGEQRWGAEAWWVGGLWLVVCRGVVGGWAMVGGLQGASTTSV